MQREPSCLQPYPESCARKFLIWRKQHKRTFSQHKKRLRHSKRDKLPWNKPKAPYFISFLHHKDSCKSSIARQEGNPISSGFVRRSADDLNVWFPCQGGERKWGRSQSYETDWRETELRESRGTRIADPATLAEVPGAATRTTTATTVILWCSKDQASFSAWSFPSYSPVLLTYTDIHTHIMLLWENSSYVTHTFNVSRWTECRCMYPGMTVLVFIPFMPHIFIRIVYIYYTVCMLPPHDLHISTVYIEKGIAVTFRALYVHNTNRTPLSRTFTLCMHQLSAFSTIVISSYPYQNVRKTSIQENYIRPPRTLRTRWCCVFARVRLLTWEVPRCMAWMLKMGSEVWHKR